MGGRIAWIISVLLLSGSSALAWSPPEGELVYSMVGAGHCDPTLNYEPGLPDSYWAMASEQGRAINTMSIDKNLACSVPLGPALVSAEDLGWVEVTVGTAAYQGTSVSLCFTDVASGYSECSEAQYVAPSRGCTLGSVALEPPPFWEGSALTAAWVYARLPGSYQCQPSVVGYSVYRTL